MVALEPVFIDIPEIETERLLLRKLTLDDVDDVFAYASDPEVAAMTTWEPHASRDDSLAFLTGVQRWYHDGDGGPWGIVIKDVGRVVGTVGLSVISWHARAELGYAIGKQWWGRGITAEASRAVLRYGFETLGLNRIEARCLPENAASERVMQKLGMTYEGRLREHMYAKGRFDDFKMYSILRREWDEHVSDT